VPKWLDDLKSSSNFTKAWVGFCSKKPEHGSEKSPRRPGQPLPVERRGDVRGPEARRVVRRGPRVGREAADAHRWRHRHRHGAAARLPRGRRGRPAPGRLPQPHRVPADHVWREEPCQEVSHWHVFQNLLI